MFKYTAIVSGTPEEVFRLAWDFDAQRRLDPRILKYEKVEDGPIQVGDHLHITVAVANRLNSSAKVILAYNEQGPPFSAVTEERPGLGVKVRVTTRYEACPEGTRITLNYGIKPAHILGCLGWLLFVPIAYLMFGSEIRNWSSRMDEELKRRRQGDRAANPSAAPQVRGMTSIGRCPYCHDDTEVEESVACASCMSRHHTDCWDELGECASCGARVRFTEAEETAGRERRGQPPLKE